ncbi:MAG TPA: aminotransferase class IV [Ignavibacteriaceae bacterium]|nr:aminotransferase class IV [Ignavibacteriaceae bacterium]
MIAYLNRKYIPEEEIRISPFDRGFLFGDGVYEVVRSYNGKFFMMKDHLKRLERNLKEVRIDFKGIHGIENISYELIKKNPVESKSDCSLYVQITRGISLPRKHTFPVDNNPTVFISLSVIKSGKDETEKGVKVLLWEDFRWSRCDIKTVGLLPGVLASQNAVEHGASETVWYRNNLICEGSHTNFFAVKNRTVITPPLSKFILPGITRKAVLSICRKINIPVREEEILKDKLEEYDEFFLTGTLTEIKPVIQIDKMKVGGGIKGPITKLIQEEFKKAVYLK